MIIYSTLCKVYQLETSRKPYLLKDSFKLKFYFNKLSCSNFIPAEREFHASYAYSTIYSLLVSIPLVATLKWLHYSLIVPAPCSLCRVTLYKLCFS